MEIREAFNQINRYLRESFSAGNGLFEYVQIFVISIYVYLADARNRIISDLIDFARTFFTRHTLLEILTMYCVFIAEKKLLVMRPYQITATERIQNRQQL